LHAKDLFNILEVYSLDESKNDATLKHIIDETKKIIPNMIPEEVVIMNSLAAKN
jgi:hypothetical protein